VCLFLSDYIYEELDKLPLIFVGILGWLKAIKTLSVPNDLISLSFLCFVFYMFVSVAIHPNSLLALSYALLFLLLFGVFLYLRKLFLEERNLYVFLRSFITLQALVCIFGLLEFIFFQFGYSSIFRDELGTYRVDSFYANPNPFGILSALSLCLTHIKGLYNLRVRAFFTICFFVGVLVSGSFMALLLVLLFALLLNFRISFVVTLGAIFSAALIFVFELDFRELLNTRLEIWEAAFKMWLEYPLFGLGTGNFQLNSLDLKLGAGIAYGLHSMYAWLLFETGVVGALMGSIFLIIFVNFSFRISKLVGVIALILLLSQLTEFFLDHEEVFSLLFVAMLARASIQKRSFNE